MKKALEYFTQFENTFELERFFSITINPSKIDAMGQCTEENFKYFKDKKCTFESNNELDMLISTYVEYGIKIRIILTLNL